MTVRFSPVVTAQQRGRDDAFSVRALDLAGFGPVHSPVVVFDDFRVHGRPFPPHPHAGFAAVTYVFPDSDGALRSRDSLGNDFVVGPGGLVWTQAGRGVIHHEVPAGTRALHGLQLFVNARASNKLNPPKTLKLPGGVAPEWTSEAGDLVRVVVGSFRDLQSSLITDEAFTLLDVELRRDLAFHLPSDDVAIVYVVQGELDVASDADERHLSVGQSIALHGTGGSVHVAAKAPARFIVASAPALDEPIIVDGPFIMNDAAQIEAAVARYRAGGMGRLDPLSSDTRNAFEQRHQHERTRGMDVSNAYDTPLSQRPGRLWRIALWLVQIMLATFFGSSGLAKLLVAPADLVTMGLNYAEDIPRGLLLFIGAAEVAGAAGLILPGLLRLVPGMTLAAAAGFAVLQSCAICLHVMREEFGVVPFNIVLLALAVLVAWGRTTQAPFEPR